MKFRLAIASSSAYFQALWQSPATCKLSYNKDVQEKILPRPSEETWMLSLASSPVLVLEGFWSWPSWASRVFQRQDQPG